MSKEFKILPPDPNGLPNTLEIRPFIFSSGNVLAEHGITKANFKGNEKFYNEQVKILQVTKNTAERVQSGFLLLGLKENGWNEKEAKRLALSEQGIGLIDKMAENAKNGNNSKARAAAYILKTAKDLLIVEALQKQLEGVKSSEIAGDCRFLAKMIKFNICGSLFVKIEGVSIADIINGKNVELSRYYKSAMEASIALRDDSFEKIKQENEDNPLMKEYPETARTAIRDACAQIVSLSIEDPDILEEQHISTHTRAEEDIVLKSRQLIRRAEDIRKLAVNGIFNYPSLQKIAEEYLNADLSTKSIALLQLGLGSAQYQIGAYLLARRFAKEGNENSAFFENFANTIRECVHDPALESVALTPKDINLFLKNEEISEDKVIPSFEEMKRITKLIPNKLPQILYRLNPQNIDYGNFKELKTIAIEFPKKDHGKFTIQLAFEDNGEKGSSFAFFVDVEREKIDWFFLDSADEPEMLRMKKAVMLSTYSILSSVQKQIETESREEQKAKTAMVHPTPIITTKLRNNPQDIWVPRIKEEKPKRQSPLTPIEETLRNGAVAPAENGIKKRIIFPINVNLRKLTKGISRENLSEIIRELGEFNKTGAGILQMLSDKIWHDGKRVYELKTGNYRILTTIAETENGTRTDNNEVIFEIYQIGNRQKYTKKKNEKYY